MNDHIGHFGHLVLDPVFNLMHQIMGLLSRHISRDVDMTVNEDMILQAPRADTVAGSNTWSL